MSGQPRICSRMGEAAFAIPEHTDMTLAEDELKM